VIAVKTVVTDNKGMIYVLCPFCRESSMKDAKLFPIHQPVSIACSCGNTHELQIEVRKDFRKETNLDGFYMKQDSPDDFENMTVTDLSLDGCSLRVYDKHTLQPGDTIKVLFKLDNAKRTKIERYATVLRILGMTIGCRLSRDVFDPELGFYVKDFKVPQYRE
jgi:hypothetical protein